MRYFHLLIGFLNLLAATAGSAADGKNCPVSFATLSKAADADPSSASWKDPAISKARLDAAISHQNRLRKNGKIPRLALTPSRTSMEGRPVFWVDTPGEFPDEPIMGQFLAYGDTLVRASYNDIHSLNHAYLFKGHQLIEAKPYGTWYLERHPSPKIALYRQVSPKEYELWKNRKFSDLGSDWGYGTKVVHFSTDRSFTTAAAPPEFPTIGVQIPTRVLLEWAKNKSIWSGILEPDQLISEFVLPANRVKELFDTQQLTFLPKP